MRPVFKHHQDEKMFRKPFRRAAVKSETERKETKALRKARKEHPRNQ